MFHSAADQVVLFGNAIGKAFVLDKISAPPTCVAVQVCNLFTVEISSVN